MVEGARSSILLPAALIALHAGSRGALADESGTSFWLLGNYATQAAVPSDPGLSIDATYYFARASAGRSASFARGGRIEVGLDSTSNYRRRRDRVLQEELMRLLAGLLVLVALVASLAGCTTTSNPYPASSRGGGWENFRADTSFDQPIANG